MNLNKELFIIARKFFQVSFRTLIVVYENNFKLKKRISKLEKKVDFLIEILNENRIVKMPVEIIEESDKNSKEIELDIYKEKKNLKSKLYKEAKILNDMIFDGEVNSNYYANEVFENFKPEED